MTFKSKDCFTTHLPDEEAQLQFAGRLADKAFGGMLVFLFGDLGAGKTTFVRGFLRALGFTGIVKSPTYTLVEPYQLGELMVYHFDLYRLADPEELEYAGGRDYFDGHSICLIEWPQQAEGFLPMPDLTINLSYAETGRNLEMSAATEMGKNVMLQLLRDELL
ncbi:MAG: tRNA (adenosine(37)-N6)-threonylcarbamoyltransferase complex ATPase subunit type 1 TsaE [Gammaproteobacteria bacterium]|nr:tRNA (adenosine(37)-N6)-threonylcarbamoyltransferase complex ATPase subunit type 1 TsaE [Gammaproteobacteria bacterium]